MYAVLINFVLAGLCGFPMPFRSVHRGELQIVSPLGRSLGSNPPGGDLSQLQRNLLDAQSRLTAAPDDPALRVWVGRRLGYLWRINDAVEVFSEGIRRHPGYAPLYRHRGHRFITLRRFQDAVTDLETAAKLIDGRSDEIELDGAPNVRNIPLTTTAFNVWYHLGVARYLLSDFQGALAAFQECLKFTRGYDDNLVAVTDWTYMCLRRLGRGREAAELLVPIRKEMDIFENTSYHRRCLMYKGLLAPDELLDWTTATDLDLATSGYGLGNWYLCNGDKEHAVEMFERVVAGPYWPAFGFIAAETDLARIRKSRPPIGE